MIPNQNEVTTLTVKICGNIQTPPLHNREEFRQSVIDTILHVLKTQDATIEYIGYTPDRAGLHHLDSQAVEYEDCVYANFTIEDRLERFGIIGKEDIIQIFVEAFENKTHRHLEVDSTVEIEGKKRRIIEMSSDWKLYLKQG